MMTMSALDSFLMYHSFGIVKCMLLVFVFAVFVNLGPASQVLRDIPRPAWLVLIFLIASGFIIRLYFVPRMHHVYFDEFVHMNIAENMMRHGEFVQTQKGSHAFCEVGTLPGWFPAHHAFLALFFSVFGVSESTAYHFSAAAGALSILAIFFAAFLLFRQTWPALCGAFFLNFTPLHLKYSGAADLSMTSFFFVAACLFAAALHGRLKNRRSLFLLSAAAALAILTRKENLILLFLLPLCVLSASEAQEKRRRWFYFFSCLAVVVILFIPYLLHHWVPASDHWPWKSLRPVVGHFGDFSGRFWRNVRFCMSGYHLVATMFLAVFGMADMCRHKREVFFFFFLWYVVFIMLYAQHPGGDFFRNADADRFALNPSIVLALAAGYGMSAVPFKKLKAFFAASILLYTAANIAVPFNLCIERTLTRDVFKEERFLAAHGGSIPPDELVITSVPAMVIMKIDKKAVAPDVFFASPDRPDEAVLFKEDMWQRRSRDLAYAEGRLREEYEFLPLDESVLSSSTTVSLIRLRKKGARLR